MAKKQAETAMVWGNDVPTGLENVTQKDLGIPFLVILQKGSAQVDKDHKDYEQKKIEGAEAGMIMNTQTNTIVYANNPDEPLLFIPSHYCTLWPEWKPRSEGGGFVKNHGTEEILSDCTRNENNDDILPNGNLIRTTRYFAGQYLSPDGEWVHAVIAMTSTQLKKGRAWIKKATAIKQNGNQVPLYAYQYKLTTTGESNDDGNWKGWVIEIGEPLTSKDTELIKESQRIATESLAASQKLLAPADQKFEPSF